MSMNYGFGVDPRPYKRTPMVSVVRGGSIDERRAHADKMRAAYISRALEPCKAVKLLATPVVELPTVVLVELREGADLANALAHVQEAAPDLHYLIVVDLGPGPEQVTAEDRMGLVLSKYSERM